jgi:hypothetical protein
MVKALRRDQSNEKPRRVGPGKPALLETEPVLGGNLMRREIQTWQDGSEFEIVLMRRFHLTPGQPEYVVVKRRLPEEHAGQRSKRGEAMPRGDKSAYTEKQTRQAEHIEEGYEERGVPEHEAEKRAWATVNKMDGGGKLSGAGRGKAVNKAPARKGGKRGGAASAARSAESKSASGRKAAKTRQRNRSAA